MKKLFLSSMIWIAVIAVAWFVYSSRGVATASENVQPFNIENSEMRIENEYKLVVPPDKVKEVWAYMLDRLVNDKTFIKSLDPDLDSYWYDELFTDVYYDTPDLIMLAHKSGIRYRTRENLTNPEHEKSGRELMQVKINDIDSQELNRGEIKFDITQEIKLNNADDLHPVLGRIKASERPGFKQLMAQLGIDPYPLRQILVIDQRRRSIYISRNGEQFISIRLDEVSSKLLWVEWEHIEMEPELNELPYTKADEGEKAYMENINAKIVEDIQQRFPEIKQDQTPKYNKAFSYFESKIPLLRFLIKNSLVQ